MGAGLLAIVAALLPWTTVNTVFTSISRNGIDGGGDGLFTLGLGIVGALALWQAGRWLWAAAISGVVIIVIGIVDIVDVQGLVDEVNADSDGLASASVGAGLYLTVIAGVVLAAVPLLQLGRRLGSGDGSDLSGASEPLPPGPPAV